MFVSELLLVRLSGEKGDELLYRAFLSLGCSGSCWGHVITKSDIVNSSPGTRVNYTGLNNAIRTGITVGASEFGISQ